VVQRTLIRPPSSRLGPLTKKERKQLIQKSPVFGQYEKAVDRESAYEVLQKRAKKQNRQEEKQREAEDRERETSGRMKRSRTGFQLPDFDRDDRPTRSSKRKSRRRRSNRQSVTEAAIKSVTRSIASSLGRALVRGLLGSLKRGF